MTPQPSARAAFFLRRLLMSEFGGWLYSPVLAAGFTRPFGGWLYSPVLAAGFTRPFGGLLCSPVWRLALLARLAACSARLFGGWLCSPVWRLALLAWWRLRLRAGFGLDCGPKFWWAWIDSNYRPRPYQGRALAT